MADGQMQDRCFKELAAPALDGPDFGFDRLTEVMQVELESA
jgi:hypothetical protein